MTGKHTPGPWEWQIHDQSMASLGSGDSPGYGTPLVLSVGPCEACASRRTAWEWGCCQTPSLANARLIAAAPDLLEACEAADRMFSEPRKYNANTVRDLIRAAIARATGDQ